MKILTTIVFSFLFLKNYSQTNNIKYVSFHNNNSIVINSEIDIYIYQVDNIAKVYIKKSKRTKQYSITIEKFTELCNAISKISPKDVIQEVRSCLDANDTKISFSATNLLPQSSVKYSVSCLSLQDNTTAWKDYLAAVNLILEIGKLKFTDLK